MDEAPGPNLTIGVVPNPVFTSINPGDRNQTSGSVKSITIIVCLQKCNVIFHITLSINVTKGTNILNVDRTELMVTVGGQPCVIVLVTANVSAIYGRS